MKTIKDLCVKEILLVRMHVCPFVKELECR